MTDNKTYWQLAEECGELVQILSKIQRFGIDYKHPETGRSNKDHLIQECADVRVFIEELQLSRFLKTSGAEEACKINCVEEKREVWVR